MFNNVALMRFINFVLVLFIVFLGYGLLFGDSGLLYKKDLQHQLSVDKQKLQILQQDNQQSRHRNSLLWEDSIDIDMLEEQNRRLFNTHKDGEIQLLLD